MATIHEQILDQVDSYLNESAKFEDKGVKAAAARARKALGELGKLSKVRRAEIQDKKNSMSCLISKKLRAQIGNEMLQNI